MINIQKKIEEILLAHTGLEQKVDIAPDYTGADFTSNAGFLLAKAKRENPSLVATQIAEVLKSDPSITDIIERVEVVGNGFMNFFVRDEVLLEELGTIISKNENYGKDYMGKGKTVVVEYSSPNIAKRFGIGHLRSTIIGQAIYNLYKFLGYHVLGDNHLGDWGTQFGMVLAQITRKHLNVEDLNVEDLERLYVEFNQEMKDTPELRDEAKAWFKKLEDGNKEARKIWQNVREVSMREFSIIYDLLNVHIDNAHPESFYEDKMSAVLEEVRQKGLSKESQGAQIFEFTNLPPALLIKSDGSTTYFSRDLAQVKFRIKEWNPDVFIYEVGVDQKLHFMQLFGAVKLLGWMGDKEFVHVAHGLIRFKEGKMSTRQGKTIHLDEVLLEAITRARHIIEQSKKSRGLDEKTKEAVAKAVGISAIKYFDLSHHPASDIIFDWEKLFVLEGNSAPYLQYTFARTQSVQAKTANTPLIKMVAPLNKEEKRLLQLLTHFASVLQSAAREYSPNILCSFLFELAQCYNAFYTQHKIIGSPEEGLRLALTCATGIVLKNGLTLLGIDTPERM